MWRVIPGSVHDVVEGEGENQTVFSVLGIPMPAVNEGKFVVDVPRVLSPTSLRYINSNLTLLDRVTPYRVYLVVVETLPSDSAGRRIFGIQLMRHWFGGSRLADRCAILLLSKNGYAEIAVGRAAHMVLSEAVAKHFAAKAMELLSSPIPYPPASNSTDSQQWRDKVASSRIDECSLKLAFYVVFTMRSRAAMTLVSMRTLSMLMMIFMMMTITVTKQQQARRYAEIYGYGGANPFLAPILYGGGFSGHPLLHEHRRQMMIDEAFWDEFESGRRGAVQPARYHQVDDRVESFLRLQLLQSILRGGRAPEYEEDEYEYESDPDADYEVFYEEELHSRDR